VPLDLSGAEHAALIALLRATITANRFPLVLLSDKHAANVTNV
jgi:hypothetical protein